MDAEIDTSTVNVLSFVCVPCVSVQKNAVDAVVLFALLCYIMRRPTEYVLVFFWKCDFLWGKNWWWYPHIIFHAGRKKRIRMPFAMVQRERRRQPRKNDSFLKCAGVGFYLDSYFICETTTICDDGDDVWRRLWHMSFTNESPMTFNCVVPVFVSTFFFVANVARYACVFGC